METIETAIRELIAEEIRKQSDVLRPKYLTFADVCERLHVTTPTLRTLIKSGRLSAVQIGDRLLFEESALTEAIREGRVTKYQRLRKENNHE